MHPFLSANNTSCLFLDQTCSAKDGLEFAVDINLDQGDRINIACHKPTDLTPELCTQTTNEVTTTSTSTSTSTSLITNTSPVTTTSTVTVTSPVTASTGTNINTTSSSVEISSTDKASEGSTTSQNDKSTNSTAMGDLVLIGGLVGGGVLLIVLILILIICLVRRKRRKTDGYVRPSPARLPPDAGYTDVDIGQQGNNSSMGEMIIDDNPVYHSYNNAESVSPRHINTNQGSDNPIQMEIIENDLYVSSDDVMNSNQIPGVEYAVVNKKRKADKHSKVTSVDSGVSMSSNEPNSDQDRKFVLGPKGDEYTLVTKT